MKLRPLALLWCFALALAGLTLAGARQASAPEGEWRDFRGSWTVTGSRRELAVEGGVTAAVFDVSGAVALTVGEGLSRGFRAEAIGFDDGRGTSLGRAVWTDEEGGRLFSRLEGEPLAAGKRIVGTITGGTGRYAGIEGGFELTWQYVVADETGRIQGRATDLRGRVRRAKDAA